MNPNTFPTKGNLILAKNSLALATQGYGLMDKKRNILLRELMGLIDQAKAIQSEIDSTFTAAYRALQKANIEMGIHYVEEIADSLPVTDDIRIKARSIMERRFRLSSIHRQKMKNRLIVLQHQRFAGRGADRLRAREGTDRRPRNRGDIRLPSCREH
mgnify:CR=1 FL=1